MPTSPEIEYVMARPGRTAQRRLEQLVELRVGVVFVAGRVRLACAVVRVRERPTDAADAGEKPLAERAIERLLDGAVEQRLAARRESSAGKRAREIPWSTAAPAAPTSDGCAKGSLPSASATSKSAARTLSADGPVRMGAQPTSGLGRGSPAHVRARPSAAC